MRYSPWKTVLNEGAAIWEITRMLCFWFKQVFLNGWWNTSTKSVIKIWRFLLCMKKELFLSKRFTNDVLLCYSEASFLWSVYFSSICSTVKHSYEKTVNCTMPWKMYSSNMSFKNGASLANAQAMKFGGKDRAVTPLLPYLLNKVNDPLLPYFHCFFLMIYNCSCLISVLVSLKNYSSLFVIWSLP